MNEWLDPKKPQRLAGTTRQRLKEYEITLKKSLGQNFLTDDTILERIVHTLELKPEDAVLEIGPGMGALTMPLAQRAKKLVAVEIDQRLVPILKQDFRSFDHVTIVHDDILKTDIVSLFETHFSLYERVHVAANLPYYITTPIIMRLLESGVSFQRLVLMMQKEVAERLAAKPGSKEYGSLSVAVQYYCDVEKKFSVPGAAFIPQPKVDSTVVRLERRTAPVVELFDETFFFAVVRASFAQRRKTLYNNLGNQFFTKETKFQLRDILIQISIDPSARGETLSMEEFARLSNALHTHFQSE